MKWERVNTTVDSDLLSEAKRLRDGLNDAALIDAAVAALNARHRGAEIDSSYAAYDLQPINQPDEWGDLASFREATAASAG